MSDDLEEGARRRNESRDDAGCRPDGETLAGSTDDDRTAEVGGRPGPDPTRYGDWEKAGRCIDF